MPQTTHNHVLTTGYVDLNIRDHPTSSTMSAYLARPQAPGTYPAVIIGFELFGITSYIRSIVERIAQLGYIALAPDFYHRSSPRIELEATPEGRTHGFELLHQLTRQQALNDVRATMTYLHDQWQSPSIAMLGLSVGGHIAYLAATQLDLKATIALYPGWLTTPDIPLSQPTPTLALTPGIATHNGYLLLLVGDQDHLIPPDQRTDIAHALQTANVRHHLITYPNTPHRFLYEQGESYRPDSANDAWHHIQTTLATELT